MRFLSLLVVLALALALPAAAQPPPGQVGSFLSAAGGPVGVYPVADGLDRPWGMTFLPDGRMLVTERSGTLRIVTMGGGVSAPVEGVPEVWAQGQGGLLDVALDPDFSANGYVYLSYARPNPNGEGAASALGRGRLVGDRIEGFEPLFTSTPYLTSGAHFGSRIAFEDDRHLLLATGERFQFDPAQDNSNHLGTIVRLHSDGSIPADNPFVDDPTAEDEIWSYGHRNIEALAFDKTTGALYVAEMGPLGGDEFNRVERGANYGWPVVSWGMDYDGELIPDPTTRPDLMDAVDYWTPTIAPSGMIHYTGRAVPGWQGSFLIGSLVYRGVVRVTVADGAITSQEIFPIGTRIREVEQGPDGLVYVLTDEANPQGRVLVLRPIETSMPE
ncbi:PQQ-dependent sugar dehydrogenase [Rubrivirga sp. IMCC45206]|uniref:PQQ-dependent sugar dehydrogenase n=1 Tax=Rubrivirga sp. IMCC45206 TaxID=3391614 RepID=UPI00398FE837